MSSYRVWRVDFSGNLKCDTNWMSKKRCLDHISEYWGHKHKFLYVSKSKNKENLIKKYKIGEKQ